MIQHILVAIDGSVRAPAVFDAAVEVAQKFAASISVVRAITVPPEWPPAAAGTPTDPLPEHLRGVALEELTSLVGRASSRGLTIAPFLVRIGTPWRVIVEVSEELDVDLIVIGSHGYAGLDHLLGTNAGRVANLARRNVLVVHTRTEMRAP
jgi:nucleotide-binding universal stress UspA family protein